MDKPNYTSQLVWVVRCEKCRWWDKEQSTDGFKGFCENIGACTHPNWYCADGEWRDEDEVLRELR